jgi:hypothetical protein
MKNNYDETINALLRSGSISIEKRGQAAILACNKSFSLLKKILDHGPILKQHRGEAVIACVTKGYTRQLQLLLSIPNAISEEDRGRAQDMAMKAKRKDLFTLLDSVSVARNQRSFKS